MSFFVIRPGFSTTIQSSARTGFREYGVPLSGAADMVSFQLANILCGNPPTMPVLEITSHGAEFLLEADALISCCGGGSLPMVNGWPIEMGRPVWVTTSSILSFTPSRLGFRSYLAVYGGFTSRHQLESSSTYTPAALGGFGGRVLHAGDRLSWNDSIGFVSQAMVKSLLPKLVNGFAITSWGASFFLQAASRVGVVRVLEGPEWDWFIQNTDRSFLSQRFIVSDRSNRMGYRLKGLEIESSEKKELISSAVCPGTIQISHDGMPILLMADAQTTGGYPRIVQVCAADLPFCAQLRPGDAVVFKKIQMAQAEALFLHQQRGLRRLETAVSMRFNQ